MVEPDTVPTAGTPVGAIPDAEVIKDEDHEVNVDTVTDKKGKRPGCIIMLKGGMGAVPAMESYETIKKRLHDESDFFEMHAVDGRRSTLNKSEIGVVDEIVKTKKKK